MRIEKKTKNWDELTRLPAHPSDQLLIEELRKQPERLIYDVDFATGKADVQLVKKQIQEISYFASLVDTPEWYQNVFFERMIENYPALSPYLQAKEIRVLVNNQSTGFHTDLPHRFLTLNYDLSYTLDECLRTTVEYEEDPNQSLSYDRNTLYILNVAKRHRVARTQGDLSSRYIISIALLRPYFPTEIIDGVDQFLKKNSLLGGTDVWNYCQRPPE
jgi:hypothetical protein